MDRPAKVYRQFEKTEMCRFFARGACKRGEGCGFAHAAEELRVAPNLTKTSLCKDWLKGRCPLSAPLCDFAHGVADLRTTPGFQEMACLERMSRSRPAASTTPFEPVSPVLAMIKLRQHYEYYTPLSLAQLVCALEVSSFLLEDPALEAVLKDSMTDKYED